MAGELAVTAVSFHAYAHLADRYLLLPHGASFGDGYGPVVVARRPVSREEIASGDVARRLSGTMDDGGARALALGARRPNAKSLPFDRDPAGGSPRDGSPRGCSSTKGS